MFLIIGINVKIDTVIDPRSRNRYLYSNTFYLYDFNIIEAEAQEKEAEEVKSPSS